MTKRQLIDEIVSLNSTAEPGFLAKFDDGELDEYLRHLQRARTPRLSGDPRRYDRYFVNCPTISAGNASAAVTVAVAESDELDLDLLQQPAEELDSAKDEQSIECEEEAEVCEQPAAHNRPQWRHAPQQAAPQALEADDECDEIELKPLDASTLADYLDDQPEPLDLGLHPAASFSQSYEDALDDGENNSEPLKLVPDRPRAAAQEAPAAEEEAQTWLF